MKLFLQVLRRNKEVLERLHRDGWELGSISPNSLWARHPSVASGAEARRRMHRLGVLFSAAGRSEVLATSWRSHRGRFAPERTGWRRANLAGADWVRDV